MLWEACELLDEQLLLSELEGRPRAAWMKTAYLLEAGERPDLADTLVKLSPSNTKDPICSPTAPTATGRSKEHPSGRPSTRWWTTSSPGGG